MADVNIDKCIAHPKKRSVPATKYTVSFHAADEAYTLYFKKPETFGMPSAVIPKGGSPTTLPVKRRVSTGYCISGPGCHDCPPAPEPPESPDDDGDPFEITIGSVARKKPKTKYKAKAKAAVKRAADVKAKAVKGKAKAKPTPKPKPKKKAAVKASKKR
jgi:hypothetical protein